LQTRQILPFMQKIAIEGRKATHDLFPWQVNLVFVKTPRFI